ncbi:M55 family metallopeptidase [bacterium]|nr:M55 family metallopeptidase [bacterium]
MKVYISADIEGVNGTTVWDETQKIHTDYPEFARQMTAEVKAACEGALAAGATEIWVKDAHGSGRNVIASELPEEAVLIRGWARHPYSMMQGIDASFQAAMMIGYHASADSGGNPLSHTINGKSVFIRMNGLTVSEFLLNAYTAEMNGVPVVYVSGDESICRDASVLNPLIKTSSVKMGVGGSTINLNPKRILHLIRESTENVLIGDLNLHRFKLPESYQMEIRFKEHPMAYHASFYPGVELTNPYTICAQYSDFFEVLRLLHFVL